MMSVKKREALSKIIDMINEWRAAGSMEHWQYSELFDVADDASAEPLRNCEVGTPKEQTIRFNDYCLEHNTTINTNCINCPLYKEKGRCEFNWGQLPYKDVKK